MEQEITTAAAPDIDLLAEQRLQEAAENAESVGEMRAEIREQVGDLMQAGTTAGNQSQEINAQVAAKLEERGDEIAKAGKGYESVRIAQDLPDGVGGQNYIGGSAAEAEVSADVVTDPAKLKEVAMHEADKEVGHGSQAAPKVGNEQAALIVDGEMHDVITVVEGDVERGVQRKLGRGAETHREDQPEEQYGKGQRMANTVIVEVGETHWDNALKSTGDYGALQKEIWKSQLERGIDRKAVVRLTEEAQITGYRTEAREALYEVAMAA
jgi:hypothetical protein